MRQKAAEPFAPSAANRILTCREFPVHRVERQIRPNSTADTIRNLPVPVDRQRHASLGESFDWKCLSPAEWLSSVEWNCALPEMLYLLRLGAVVVVLSGRND